MKRRKADEDHLWAQLTGNENAIRALLEDQARIRRELQSIEIERVRETK